jgi:hypothetical protein
VNHAISYRKSPYARHPPVEYRHKAGTVVGHQDVAFDEVEVKHVLEVWTRANVIIEGPLTGDERRVEMRERREFVPPAAHPAAGVIDQQVARPLVPRGSSPAARYRQSPHRVERTEQRGQHTLKPRSVQRFEERPGMALRDGIRTREPIAALSFSKSSRH